MVGREGPGRRPGIPAPASPVSPMTQKDGDRDRECTSSRIRHAPTGSPGDTADLSPLYGVAPAPASAVVASLLLARVKSRQDED
jgi:hypothetical protein